MATNEARRDLSEKLRFERMLIEDIRAFNKKMVRQTVIEYAEGAGALDAKKLQPELIEILDNHYDRVGDPFSEQITEILPRDIEATDSEISLIAVSLLTFFAARAVEQANIITATNQRDIATSIDSAISIGHDEAIAGRPQTRRDTAIQAGVNLNRKLAGRVTGIAALETQAAAESAKATEAQVLTGQPPSVIGGSPREAPVTKEWVTVGDERVRAAHVFADSQTRNLNKAFTVGGQQLRWPGDTSLGASASNVIKCRCSSVVSAESVFSERRLRTDQVSATRPINSADPIPTAKPVPIVTPKPKPEITKPVVNSPKIIKTLQKAEPVKPIRKVSKSTTSTRVTDEQMNRADKPPILPKEVKLTGDQSAYVEYYKGTGFYKSNEVLRNPKAFSSGEISSARKMRDSINSAVKKSEMKTDGVLFRGIKSPELFDNAEKLIGKDIPIPTPQSTATNAGSAVGWSGLLRLKGGKFVSSNPGQSVVFKIRTKKGQHGLDLESLSIGNTAESEVLLGSGGKYKVAGVKNLTDGSGNITGKVIEVDYNE